MNKKVVSVAIASAMATPMAAQAVKYKLSGQVNRAIVFQDDGTDSQVRNVDAISSGTRFRLRGSEDLGNGVQVGFYWEMQTSSNASFNQNPQLNGDTGDGINGGATIRHANVWFSGQWGKLTLGQGDGAGNGATEVDMSGTAISGQYHGRTSFTGGMAWRTSNGAATGLTSGNTYTEFDAFSRYDQIRYDSPALGPVTLAASIGNANRWEAAARLNTGLGGGKLGAALFYGQDSGRDIGGADTTRYGGSASFLFSQGTSVTVAYARQELDGAGTTDSDVFSVKVGHKWGPHAVSAGYSHCEDCTGVGGVSTEDDGIGIGYVYSLKKANTQIYAGFQHDELDIGGGPSVDDHNTVVVGARVRFD